MALGKHSSDIENIVLAPSSQSPSTILRWARRLTLEAFWILLSLVGIPLVVLLTFAQVCIVFLVLFQTLLATGLDGIFGLGIFLAMAPVLLFCQVCFHEIGHLTMAMLARYELHLIKLGPFLIVFGQGQKRFGFDWSLRRPAGYVLASPSDTSSWRLRQVFFTIGGPATNLVAGVACLIAASALNQSAGLDFSHLITSVGTAFTSPVSLVVVLFNLAGLIGLLFAFANLVPYQFGPWSTDGMLLLQLLIRRDGLKRDLLLHLLGRSMSKGTRPRDWETIQVEQLQDSLTGDSTDSRANLYCYYHYLDCGQIEQAGQYLERALTQYAGYPVVSRNSLFLEGAYFEARYRSNVAAAFGWLADSKEGNAEEQTHCRAEAALLWARGRFAEAASRAEAGLKAIPRSRDLGGRLAEKEWLEELLRACRRSIGEVNALAR